MYMSRCNINYTILIDIYGYEMFSLRLGGMYMYTAPKTSK